MRIMRKYADTDADENLIHIFPHTKGKISLTEAIISKITKLK